MVVLVCVIEGFMCMLGGEGGREEYSLQTFPTFFLHILLYPILPLQTYILVPSTAAVCPAWPQSTAGVPFASLLLSLVGMSFISSHVNVSMEGKPEHKPVTFMCQST